MKLTDDEAKSFGVATNHERMINGEHRFRLNHVDGSSYCRTEATDAGWQNSHYHKGVTEWYVVQSGWIAYAEQTSSKESHLTILEEGEGITVRPMVPHNIFMSENSVIHTVKATKEKHKNDWFASPELDAYTSQFTSEDLFNKRMMKSLRSTRLSLREFYYSDWKSIHDYAKRPEVSRYQVWEPQSETDSQHFLAERMVTSLQEPRFQFAYAIIQRETNTLIGSVELTIRDVKHQAAELSYILHPDYWGKGYATEAAGLMLSFGFYKMNLHRIYAKCDPRNKGSERVMQKIGMVWEGRLREDLLLSEGWRDSLIYSILARDYNS
ncbi:GNAT family protein [Alkalicoccobacillus gibsonii]|uniref:GNAT family protein n=1 Tax=Alkalicoccobacillus gibsonii TaxID=79881 RepID=A0ABU9VEW4_9BACI